MPIPVIDTIVPQNNGLFPTHDSQYGLGGWHEVITIADRDNIPIQRRRAGMAVNVSGQLYILGSDLATWDLLVISGVGEAPTDGNPFVRQNGSWVDLNTFLDPGTF